MAIFAVLDWLLFSIEVLMVLLILWIEEKLVVVLQLPQMMLKLLSRLGSSVEVVEVIWMLKIQVASPAVVAMPGCLPLASTSVEQFQHWL